MNDERLSRAFISLLCNGINGFRNLYWKNINHKILKRASKIKYEFFTKKIEIKQKAVNSPTICALRFEGTISSYLKVNRAGGGVDRF